MHHGEAEPTLGSPRSDAKVVAADVRVVQAQQLDIEPAERHVSSDVGEVLPSLGDELTNELGGAAPTNTPAPAPARQEVGEVVHRLRDEIVVGAEDEPGSEPAADRPNRFHRGGDRLGFGEEVARHDRDVRRGQRREEPSLPRIATHEVQVGEVQNDEGLRGRR